MDEQEKLTVTKPVREKKLGSVSIVGAASLLIIFAVLCLAIFALLSLSTATRGERLSTLAKEKTVEYYTAEAEAERIIGFIRGGGTDSRVSFDGTEYSFTVPCGDTTELCIRFTDTEIIEKTTQTTVKWEANEDLNVWDGE